MSVQRETSVIQMPHVLTLMVPSPAHVEMGMLEMASEGKTAKCLISNSIYLISTAQCTTNFQLVLGPVDSCLNLRVSIRNI